jgi:hypothetical protein
VFATALLAAAPLDALLSLVTGLILAALGFAGAGAAVALLRVVLPGVARAADDALLLVSTSRALVSGVLPLVGAMLVSWGLAGAGLPPAWSLLVWIPVLVLTVLGALAAVPHVGERLLATGASVRSPLARAVFGATAIGLAHATWVLSPLGLLVSLTTAGWCLGVGLGIVAKGRNRAAIIPPR